MLGFLYSVRDRRTDGQAALCTKRMRETASHQHVIPLVWCVYCRPTSGSDGLNKGKFSRLCTTADQALLYWWQSLSLSIMHEHPQVSATADEMHKARFPLPELTARVNGQSWRVNNPCINSIKQSFNEICRRILFTFKPIETVHFLRRSLRRGFHYPSTRPVLTGNGNRSPVNSGRQLG